jgi:hypothetical protein
MQSNGEIDLDCKGACIFGLPDSGKSTLARSIARTYGAACFVYDTLHEYPPDTYDHYRPADRYSVPEYERVIRAAMVSGKYKLIIVDESNRFNPSKPKPLPQATADLNDWRSHYDLSTIHICRLPVQLNQDLTEQAHYLFIFRMPGKNSIAYLNDSAEGLGEAASHLLPYHFLIVHPDRIFQVSAPVPRDNATNKKIKSHGGALKADIQDNP